MNPRSKIEDAILASTGKPVSSTGSALCPAHEDSRESLSVGEGNDGKVLLKCHAGCSFASIMAALGLDASDAFPEEPNRTEKPIVKTYDYTDEYDQLLYQVVRYQPKEFKQRKPDGNGGWVWRLNGVRRVLYRLSSVVKAASEGREVVVCEGERDVEHLEKLGFTATTNSGGADKWRSEYSEFLRGADVAIIADNDRRGKRHAIDIANSIYGKAKSVRLVTLPGVAEKGDVTDWILAGGTQAQLKELISATEEYERCVENHSPDYRWGVTGERKAAVTELFKRASESACSAAMETSWLVDDLLPANSLTLLTGSPKGSGKTTFILHLVRSLLSGERFLGRDTEQTPVVFLTEQSEANFLSEYLRTIGLSDFHDLHLLYAAQVTSYTWLELVQGAVQRCCDTGARLLVIDTLAHFARLGGDTENSAGPVLKTLRPTQDAVAEHGINITLVHHDRKSGGDVWHSGRGSSALTGAADLLLRLRRPEGNHQRSLRRIDAVGRFASLPDRLTIELKEGVFVSHGDEAAVAAKTARNLLLKVLPDDATNALSEKDLLQRASDIDTGVKRTTFNDTIRSLHDAGEVHRVGRGVKGDPYLYSKLP